MIHSSNWRDARRLLRFRFPYGDRGTLMGTPMLAAVENGYG